MHDVYMFGTMEGIWNLQCANTRELLDLSKAWKYRQLKSRWSGEVGRAGCMEKKERVKTKRSECLQWCHNRQQIVFWNLWASEALRCSGDVFCEFVKGVA